MMKIYTDMPCLARYLLLFLLVTLMASCSSDGYEDIDAFMQQVQSQPEGVIEPIPVFKPYKAFRYNAAAKRSPFAVPVKIREIALLSMSSDVEPDPNRVKEPLEAFNLEALSMVGTLERDGKLWALVEDGNSVIHQVLPGNYMGRNHGRVVGIDYDSIALVEIISNSADTWIERPRTLNLVTDG